MGADDKSFLNDKVNKLLFRFAVPAIFSLLVGEFYNIIAIVFAGRYIGTNAIGALTVEFPIQRFFIALGLLIAVGTSTYAARIIGKKDISELKKIIVNSFILTLTFLILISLMVFVFRSPILYALGASHNTYPLANKYVSIVLIGSVFQALSAVICYMMISFNQTRIMLYTNLIGVSFNILISYIFIANMGMGIEGSAIAAVVAQIVSCMFAFFKFINLSKALHIQFSNKSVLEYLNIDILNQIIVCGFSTFIVEISDAVVAGVLNNVLYSTGGDSAIIIVGVIEKTSMFIYSAIIGISSGMQPIVGYNFGAEKYERVKEVLKSSIKIVIVLSIVFWAIFLLFSYEIIGFFLKDKALLYQTINAFRISISMIPLLGIYYVTMYYYQAIGESKKSFLLSIYREIIIFIPLALFLVKIFGMKGAIIAYPITDGVVILTSIYFMKKALEEEFGIESTSIGMN
ncbi:MATE family efflux transporter [Clostridium kluyveri]|nr:MATE family efflux transporter [Clostridium kluyveri]APM39492.1 MATE family efflux transporter [Clostridium kluyveri]UZQ50378.1 MATE family efflux transporter [Clostridium kluyveri]